MAMLPPSPPSRHSPLPSLLALMLRLGFTAFGGPAAHLAMLEREVVQRRGWLTAQEFLDLLGATNLIPGPNSTEMMIHIGMSRAGVAGLWLAGLAFIMPAALITLAFAAAYVSYGALPAAAGVLAGIKPAVVAIIAAAVWKLGRAAAKRRPLALLGVVVLGLYLWQGQELALLLGSGLLGMIFSRATGKAATKDTKSTKDTKEPQRTPSTGESPAATEGGKNEHGRARALSFLPLSFVSFVFFVSFVVYPIASRHGTATPAAVGLFFLRIGSVLFGSGYVLLAFLREGLVIHHGWLTQRQLLDAVAVGQFTPGPVFSTATFIGYLIAGVPGAVAATVGIFLPSFFFVWATHPLVARLRTTPWTAGFLDGVNIGSVALMAGVTAQLALGTLTDWRAGLIAVLALAVVLKTRLNAAWVILGGALLGLWR